MANKVTISEHEIQAAFFEWVRLKKQTDDKFKMIYAVPNGGTMTIWAARRMVKEGLTKGALDVVVDVPMRGYHGLRLEFKSEKGVLTKEQKEMSELLVRFGYAVSIIRSVEQAMSVVAAYFYEPTKCGVED